MENQESVTITRQSYDKLKKSDREIKEIKDKGIKISKESIIRYFSIGETYHSGYDYSIISLVESQKDGIIKEEIELLKDKAAQERANIQKELREYKLKFGEIEEIEENEKPIYKKLWFGLYIKK